MQTRPNRKARPPGHAKWLADLKRQIFAAQHRAVLAVHREVVLLYWQLGRNILEREERQEPQEREGSGSGIVEQLARDFGAAFSETKGFSRTNLLNMRAFAQAWPDPAIVQQVLGQLPWGHNLVLLTKLKTPDARLAYAQRAIEHGWSCDALVLHIERLHGRANA